MDTTPSLKPSGYFLTTALVESLYHILPEECRSTPIIPSERLRGLVHAASQLLQTLSRSVATASKVYQYLRDLLPFDDGFELPDNMSGSPPSQNLPGQHIPVDFSADLGILSETFWRAIADRPVHDSSSLPILTNSKGQELLPSAVELPEGFAPDCLPLLDDLQCKFLMDLDLEDMPFNAPPSVDYYTANIGGDLL